MLRDKYPIDIEECKRSNILITGTNQVGKSRLAMALSDILMVNNWHVIVFDTVGHWKEQSNIPYFYKVSENTMQYIIPEDNMIFDISMLLPSYQREFLEMVLHDLWQWKTKDRTVWSRRWMMIVLEEAQLYMRNIRGLVSQNMMRICSVGANHKIRTLAISPSLTGLDCEFIRLAQQRYHFKLGNELNAKRRFRGYYGKDWQRVTLAHDVGCFTYYLNGKLKVHCVPEFHSSIKPQKYRKPKLIKAKPQSFVDKLLGKPVECEECECYDVYGCTEEDEDDAFTEEENEDLWEF